MKKAVIYIISIVIIICVLITSKLYEGKHYLTEIKKFNTKYEKYLANEIIGTEVASVINQAVDDNENERIKKDENGKYIQNNETSINIEVKITEFKEEQIYTMEALYGGGMTQFVKYYGQIPFKCAKVEYNENKRIKYILFEQVLN
ncbi:MAG: hypothetical protein IJK18_04825 [Clostridia bacterium]|nr:hypothetical protein [Clostridia bacterium]